MPQETCVHCDHDQDLRYFRIVTDVDMTRIHPRFTKVSDEDADYFEILMCKGHRSAIIGGLHHWINNGFVEDRLPTAVGWLERLTSWLWNSRPDTTCVVCGEKSMVSDLLLRTGWDMTSVDKRFVICDKRRRFHKVSTCEPCRKLAHVVVMMWLDHCFDDPRVDTSGITTLNASNPEDAKRIAEFEEAIRRANQ